MLQGLNELVGVTLPRVVCSGDMICHQRAQCSVSIGNDTGQFLPQERTPLSLGSAHSVLTSEVGAGGKDQVIQGHFFLFGSIKRGANLAGNISKI